MTWTDDRLALLRKRWDEGHSCTEIALELSDGVTRNAVIGKVHRLGLTRGAHPKSGRKAGDALVERPVAKPKSETRESARPTPKPLPIAIVVEPVPAGAPAPGSRMLSIVDLSIVDHYKYVYGDPRDFDTIRYCAADVVPGSSYCSHHRAACCNGHGGRLKSPYEPRSARQEQHSAFMKAFHEKRSREQTGQSRITVGKHA